jgi:hypothetical protein
MDSHYPSTAELAAFRRAILSQHPGTAEHPARFVTLANGRAWPHERQHGIGWTQADYAMDEPIVNPSHARREASAMRSRAFDRLPRVLSLGPCYQCGATDVHYSDCAYWDMRDRHLYA